MVDVAKVLKNYNKPWSVSLDQNDNSKMYPVLHYLVAGHIRRRNKAFSNII